MIKLILAFYYCCFYSYYLFYFKINLVLDCIQFKENSIYYNENYPLIYSHDKHYGLIFINARRLRLYIKFIFIIR